MQNVLVLGANGFIGQNLIQRLSSEVDIVVGYDRSMPEKHLPYLSLKGDFLQEKNFEEILRHYKIDTVYHLISTTFPSSGTTQIVQEMEENVIPTVRLLEAMKNVGAKSIIFASSGGTVYGESMGGAAHRCADALSPICTYGLQKLIIEECLNFYGRLGNINCYVARISNPYGIILSKTRAQGIIPIFISKLLSNEPITVYGETIRDYIHISDVINALVLIGQYKSTRRIFNIGTGVPTDLHTLIKMLENIVQRTFVGVNKQDRRDCDVYENVLDISDTISELGWQPKIALEEGIRITLHEMLRGAEFFHI